MVSFIVFLSVFRDELANAEPNRLIVDDYKTDDSSVVGMSEDKMDEC